MTPKKLFFYQSLAAVVSGFAITAIVAFAWTEPLTAPPGGNVSAPLNVGNVGQSKLGGLILNTGGATYGLIVDKGDVGIGTTEPQVKLDVNGDIRADGKVVGDFINRGGIILSRPTCDSVIRGMQFFVQDAANDDLYLCKLKDGLYQWVVIANSSPSIQASSYRFTGANTIPYPPTETQVGWEPLYRPSGGGTVSFSLPATTQSWSCTYIARNNDYSPFQEGWEENDCFSSQHRIVCGGIQYLAPTQVSGQNENNSISTGVLSGGNGTTCSLQVKTGCIRYGDAGEIYNEKTLSAAVDGSCTYSYLQ